MGKRWTDTEDRILVTLRGSGMPSSAIASSMGRSTQAIYQRAYVLNCIGRNEPTFREVVDAAFAKHGMERDIKPKPQWWKAMMWWRK